MIYMIGFAQDDMDLVWEVKMDHEIEHSLTGTEDRGYSIAASQKEISLFSNETGRVKWTSKFKEIAPKLKKVNELIPFWESNTIFLFDRKMGKDQIACLEMQTGKVLWTTDKYQNITGDNVVYLAEKEGFLLALKEQLVFIKVATGEETWATDRFKGAVGQYVYMPDGHIVMVNFKPGGLAHLFTGFKNQIVKINTVNGDIEWEASYIGRAERKVISREWVFDLAVEGDKVILRMNGIQVYDYNTGAPIWTAAFDFTPDIGVKSPKDAVTFGIYHAVADPVLEDQKNLYVLDMSNKKSQYIKKYDANSGKLIWTSGEIKEARAIPGMTVADGVVALQVGGAVEAQAYIRSRQKSADGSVRIVEQWKIWFPNVKPMGIQAFSSQDGTQLWESERFKKGITNAIYVNKDYIVCSGKELYSMNLQTGAENYAVPVAKGGVGNATLILPYNDMIVVVGEKGVSTFNPENGDLINTGKYKSASLLDLKDDLLVMKTDKADLAAFDLNTCKYREFKAKTGADTDLTTDGHYVYIYEKKKVYKVKTR